MKPFLISIFIICSIASYSQTSAGIKGGLNLSQIKFSNTDYDVNMIPGFYGGIFVNQKLNDDFSLQLELFFSTEGTNEKTGGVSGKIQESYLHLPLLLQYRFLDQWQAEVGPQIGYLISSKEKFNGNTDDIRQYYKKTDFRIPIGIGYNISENVKIGLRYSFSLSKINKDDVAGGNLRNQVLHVGLQYSFSGSQ